MSVSSVSDVSSAASATQLSASAGSTLSMNDFFELMAAELQNQTMYDTVDNAEYMGQMAQFSMLSQMQELAQKCDCAYAVSLIGKNVSVTAADENGFTQQITGAVEQVSFSDGAAYVTVGGQSYDASDIVSVSGD